MEYLRMKTQDTAANVEVVKNDWNEVTSAVHKLASHTLKFAGLGLFTIIFQWLACISAIWLLVLDKTNWKTNILTGLLVPYIFFSLPDLLFSFLRGEIGMWIAFVTVILRVFFPKKFPDWLELPGAVILIIVVAPSLIAGSVRGNWLGACVCLVIGGYLLQEHIRASGGFKNAFTKANGVMNSIGILLLFVYPVWDIINSII
ncbi:cold-regulated 413 plasma membrane protein 1-like [Silene latifolia]|uniref:cold-regulated 413 plasma membrane protein 1-like n=1 Tax=Silene latifolia TaxID=37657 RepID=UPI003D7750FD